jgi:hypothetical protein
MTDPMTFVLWPRLGPWRGGEPRVFAVDEENRFPERLETVRKARLIDVRYEGGGITTLLDQITASCGVMSGSFQAVLENLENLSHEQPLVVVVRAADRLLADTGPALLHVITGWEGFTHHGNGVSAMYLVLETGPRAVTDSAFYPGGVVEWLSK